MPGHLGVLVSLSRVPLRGVQKLAKSSNLGASGTTKMPEGTVALIDKMRADAESVDFEDVMSAIEEGFDISEVSFTVGEQKNEAGSSCFLERIGHSTRLVMLV